MCVIVFKPAGAECPSLETLSKCWESNPDGAGVAWSEHKSVFMRKGFMKFSDLEEFYYLERLQKREGQAVMFHFRIGTHGVKDAGNTHPFPVAATVPGLRRLTGRYPEVLAHNGIFQIKIEMDKVSDTGQFVAEYCKAGHGDIAKFWKDNSSLAGWSRLVSLRPKNRYTMLGDWHTHKDTGCFFSNGSWNFSRKSYGCNVYSLEDGDLGTWFDQRTPVRPAVTPAKPVIRINGTPVATLPKPKVADAKPEETRTEQIRRVDEEVRKVLTGTKTGGWAKALLGPMWKGDDPCQAR